MYCGLSFAEPISKGLASLIKDPEDPPQQISVIPSFVNEASPLLNVEKKQDVNNTFGRDTLIASKNQN